MQQNKSVKNIIDGRFYDIWNLPKGMVINGDLDLSGLGLTELPDLSTIEVNGRFICSDNLLSDLRNGPKYARVYICSENPELTSLTGAPENVDVFNCSKCPKLQSFVGGPERARLYMALHNDGLQDLTGVPESVDTLIVNWCQNLKNLHGAPKKARIIDVSYNPALENLDEAPKACERVICDWDNDIADAVNKIDVARKYYRLGTTKPNNKAL